MERAEAQLEGAFRRGFSYRTHAEERQSTRKAIALKCQEIHEKILGYGLLPSLLAFTATGLGRERARDVLDGTSETGLFSTITPENADAILSAAHTGMTAATCAAMAVLLAVGANQFRGTQEQRKFDSSGSV
jgi:hypothetical protein